MRLISRKYLRTFSLIWKIRRSYKKKSVAEEQNQMFCLFKATFGPIFTSISIFFYILNILYPFFYSCLLFSHCASVVILYVWSCKQITDITVGSKKLHIYTQFNGGLNVTQEYELHGGANIWSLSSRGKNLFSTRR
mgnify:CR=1 FL=1